MTLKQEANMTKADQKRFSRIARKYINSGAILRELGMVRLAEKVKK
jgi:hypothetical protein